MREWGIIWTTLIALVLIAGACTKFHLFLKDKYYERIDLTPVVWTTRKPKSLVHSLIQSRCKPELGKLDEFLQCRDRVRDML